MLEHSKDNLRILHPLPRVNEISYDVDSNPKAYYFQQAKTDYSLGKPLSVKF